MSMSFLIVITTMLSAVVVLVIQSNSQICYINSSNCLPSSNMTPCYKWSDVTRYFDQCIKVCEVLLFPPGVYFLNGTLLASDERSISLIGASVHATSIVCVDKPSLFVAANMSELRIMNITWINCGGTFEDITVPRSYTTFLLHNVISAVIFNVAFNNSQGYALFGVNLQSKLMFVNVNISGQNFVGHTAANDSKGIMILNLPTLSSMITENNIQSQKCFVLIDNCKFHNMYGSRSTLQRYAMNSSYMLHDATAIGLVFHQQIIVKISNTQFVNVLSNNIPTVLISYSLRKLTYVTIINSTFSNISCIEKPLFKAKLLAKFRYSFSLHVLFFKNCTFLKNNATHLIQMSHLDTAVGTTVPMKVKIQLLKILFYANTAVSGIWKVHSNSYSPYISILIVDSSFLANHVSDLRFKYVHSLTLKGRNTFDNNFAEVQIYLSCLTTFSLQGNAMFSNNKVNILFYLSKHLILDVNTSLNITNNQIAIMNDMTQHHDFYLIYIIPDILKPDDCTFQISHCDNVTLLNISVMFHNNTGYQGPIYGYPFNNCKWNHYCNQIDIIPSSYYVFENIIHYDQSNSKSISGKEDSICICESNLIYAGSGSISCSNTRIDNNIYPGQTTYFSLINTAFNSPVSVTSHNEDGTSICASDYDNICSPSPPLGIVYQSCVNLTYTIRSNFTNWCMLCLKTITQSQDSAVYSFNITLQECPLGLIHYNGQCICNPKLKNNVKGLICNLDNTLVRLPYTWISAATVMHNMTDIAYTNECYSDYCSTSITTNFNLNDPDVQCAGSRSGVACGRCDKGLSAVFGSSRCKRCTNIWLLLIPVLAVAGILLVWLLFKLNLTVMDGHIYGYIFYVNILSLYSLRIFPSNILIYFPFMMSNLDIGIEVCFYNGMTNYATIWLQFIFPLYVILLVIGLSIASRYSQRVERLTRKRVIPVIATLYLLAYNKMMFITAKGLFAYRTIHYLQSQKTDMYWSLDTQIPLFGLEFTLLFIFCISLLLLILLPTLLLFLFPKSFLKYKFIAKYVKPFLDAYQAPFKDTRYNHLGVEMIIRAIIYGCETLRADYTALTYALIALLYLTYSSLQQPFKSLLNTVIYTMYICNLGCIAIIFMYSPMSNTKLYIVAFNCLVGVGFAFFLGIILLHIFKYCLCRNFSMMISKKIMKCKDVFLPNQAHNDAEEMEAKYYVQYREESELLSLD